ISIAAGTDLAQGETITLTVTGTLTTSVFPGQEINNEAVVEWTTQDGENEEERSYEDRDDVDITIDTVFDLEKSLTDESQTQVTVGETVGYTLTLTLIEGTTPAVFVTDELP